MNETQMMPGHAERSRRVMRWFAPARFGFFYHWGLFTGGGSSCSGSPAPVLRHASIAEFETAAPAAEVVARNMVATARRVGAGYITFTVVHSCDGWAVMYPTKVPGFIRATTRDYVGALLAEGTRRGVKVILYMPGGMGHWDTPGGPWVGENLRTPDGYAAGLTALVRELVDRYGTQIGGFWLDGLDEKLSELPVLMHELLPESVVLVNNRTRFNSPDVDASTTEFLSNMPEPLYNRPGGLLKPIDWIGGMLPPMRDFNEDIPTCNDWWHGAPPYVWEFILPFAYRQGTGNYQRDARFWIREMLCSLGMRGQWNYAMGLGPLLDGTVPPEFEPMIAAMATFMSWAGESVTDTIGGEGSGLVPGWCNDGAFCPVTVSLKNPAVHYLHVTEAPTTNVLCVQTNFRLVRTVEDLRTGQPVPFTQNGALEVASDSWADVATYGAAVFRVTMEQEPH